MTKTTAFTLEKRLGFSIAAFDVSTLAAPLRGVTRVNCDNPNPFRLSLVTQKPSQLGKAPRVEAPFGFAAPRFRARANLREVFDNNCSSDFRTLQNTFGKNMIAVAPETLLASRKALEVPSGASRTVRLQRPLQTKAALFDFFPMPFAVKTVVAAHCRTRDAQIHADGFLIRLKNHIRQIDDDVQIPLAFLPNQVRRCGRLSNRIRCIIGNFERHLLPSGNGREIGNTAFPIQCESAAIETRRAKGAFRLRSAALLLLPCERRFHRFAGFLTGLNVQVRHKRRIRFFGVVISDMVQLVGVAFPQAPSRFTNGIKRLRERHNRCAQSVFLLRRGFEAQANRSLHTANYTI